MKSNKLINRLQKNRPMTQISIRIPQDVLEDLKRIPPRLGFSGYQPLIRAYIGQGLRADLARLNETPDMEIHELVIEMKLLERRLTLYEEKYSVLSEDFHNALMSGKLADYDAYDETRTDLSRWKGLYEIWLRRKKAYSEQIQQRSLAEMLPFQPAY